MKDILGHKSRDLGEIVDILLGQGNYTCPTPCPHYRYDRAKAACHKLRKLGLLRKTGEDRVCVNLAVTERFLKWKTERETKLTDLGVVKWGKAQQLEGTSGGN